MWTLSTKDFIEQAARMRFSILSLCWIALYVAVALASLQHPTTGLSAATELMWQLSVAMALVIAFHRRSTPLFSFVVFNLLSTLNYAYLSDLTIPVMLGLGVTTGAVEYENVQSMLCCHISFLLGLAGLVIGHCVVRFIGVGAVRDDETASVGP